MDKVSQRALRRIANFTLPLTSIHTNFERPQDPEEPYIGCGEGEKVGDVKGGKKCCEKKEITMVNLIADQAAVLH